MNPILKNILAVVVGIIAGSAVNMLLVNLNGSLIALPEGADLSDMSKLKESMKLFQPIHFLFPISFFRPCYWHLGWCFFNRKNCWH
jgi:hypothetical protein